MVRTDPIDIFVPFDDIVEIMEVSADVLSSNGVEINSYNIGFFPKSFGGGSEPYDNPIEAAKDFKEDLEARTVYDVCGETEKQNACTTFKRYGDTGFFDVMTDRKPGLRQIADSTLASKRQSIEEDLMDRGYLIQREGNLLYWDEEKEEYTTHSEYCPVSPEID